MSGRATLRVLTETDPPKAMCKRGFGVFLRNSIACTAHGIEVVDGDIGDYVDIQDIRDVAATVAGDEQAYRRLVERYQVEIGTQMRRFSRDPDVRLELTHDVFVEAYMSLRTYRHTAPFLHWLRKIAIRVGYRHWKRVRSNNREKPLTEDDWQQLTASQAVFGEAEMAAELVHRILERLSPPDRLILTLLYLDGCNLTEAARRAGWTVAGTKLRAFRARSRLRKVLTRSPP